MKGWRKRLGDAIEAIAAAGGPDMKALSKKAGLSAGYIHSILKQGRTPSVEKFLRVAEACGVEPGWLLFGDERFQLQFPVIGSAATAEGWQPTEGSRIDKVPFEPGTDSHDMIVIEVRGHSNAPAYRDQDLLFCSRHAGGNLHNIVVGRDCVVRTRDGVGYIKHVVEGTRPGAFNLRSVSNPVAKDVKNVALDWAAPIVWIKRGGR